MDFSNPTLSLLSKNTTQISQTYVQNTNSLVKLIDMLRPLYGPRSSKVLISKGNFSTQTLTDITKIIFDMLPITSSNNIIIKDILNKITGLGDGSTFTVLFSAILSKNIISLIDKGVSRKIVSNLLKKIRREVSKIEIEKEDVTITGNVSKILGSVLKDKDLIRVFDSACSIIFDEKKTSVGMKQILSELDDRLRIIKIPIGTNKDSEALDGFVFKGASKTAVKEAKDKRTAIFNCPIEISRTTTKGVLLLKNATDLLNFSSDEETNIKNCVEEISKNNSVIICSGKIEDMYLEYLNKKDDLLLYSFYSKHDIRRIRNLFGGSINPLLREVMKENCGKCEEIKVLEFGTNKYSWFRNKDSSVATIILKNSINLMLDENERVIQKGIKVLQKNSKDGKVLMVKGGGIMERHLGDKIEDYSLEKNDEKDSCVILVAKAFKKSLYDITNTIFENKDDIYDIYNVRIKTIQYAIDICCVILETQDQFAVREALNIKPKTNPNWDNDD